jgi:hypothetical protein
MAWWLKEKLPNTCFNLIIALVTLFAVVASLLGKKRANPSLRSGRNYRLS